MILRNDSYYENHNGKYLMITAIIIFLLLFLSGTGFIKKSEAAENDNTQAVHIFYYSWYGNPEVDGSYFHWNSSSQNAEGERDKHYPGGDDIGANFYPQLGCYSSNDEKILETHMQELNRANVSVISISWWGIGTFEDKTIPRILDAANRYSIKVNIHIEPIGTKTADVIRESIIYCIDKYGSHPAFYRDSRYGNRPLFYVFLPNMKYPEDWAELLKPGGSKTIRGTKYDALVINHWAYGRDQGQKIIDSGFDGFYTYFVSDQTSTANPDRWRELAEYARENNLLFIPCVGPGYDDTRIRRGNQNLIKERDGSRYYDKMFQAAIDVKPQFIAITSFNEWHEGTMIEPAVPKSIRGYKYEDYGSKDPDFYLDRTRFWVEKYLDTIR